MTVAEMLKEELETFERHKEELQRQGVGKFVVIHGSQVVGVWDTYEDALRAAYKQFGLEPFLVKEIKDFEYGHSFSRDLAWPS